MIDFKLGPVTDGLARERLESKKMDNLIGQRPEVVNFCVHHSFLARPIRFHWTSNYFICYVLLYFYILIV